MALNENTQKKNSETLQPVYLESETVLRDYHHSTYREFPESGHSNDMLQQLRSNIQQLDDLQGRMGFMVSEIRGLLKKF